MSIIADEFTKEENNVDVKINYCSSYELNLTYLSALEALDDLEKLENLEIGLLTAESGEDVVNCLNAAGYELDESLTTETAMEGKKGILAKIGDIKNKILAANTEIKDPISKLLDNLFVSINGLKKLKEDLAAGKYIVREKAGFFQKGHAELIGGRVGLILGMGLDPNKADNIVKLLGMPKYLASKVMADNFKLLNLMQDGIVNNAEDFMKRLSDGKLTKSDESIKFIKSLKGLNLKDLDIVAGFTPRVFSPICSTVIIHVEEGKLKVESDSTRFPNFKLQPQTNINDVIKVVDAAIKEFSEVKAEATNLKNMVNSASRFKDLVVNQSANVVNPMVAFSKVIRYKQNLLRAAVNLQYDFSEISMFTKSYVKVMAVKK